MPNLRQTAYKIWIGDLLKAEYVKQEGEWEPNYFLIGENKVSRVNIIISVVNIYENPEKTMKSVDVDDGSGSVSLKTWGEDMKVLEGLDIGDICLVIGKCKNSSGQIFVTPEIVRKMDGAWAKLRKLELKKLYGVRERVEGGNVSENVDKPVDSASQKVLGVLENSEEISFDDLREKIGINEEELKNMIIDLVKEGQVFEPRPGYLRVV